MKILVAGAGSIGKRHAKNAKALGCEAAIFDADTVKAKTVADTVGVMHFKDLDGGLEWKPHAVIIGTPHSTHIEIATKAMKAGAHVLIEKPLANNENGMEEFLKVLSASQRKAFVVCNTRFHPAIAIMKEHVARVGHIYFARTYYGEHLPTMRPGVDYRKIYAANKSMGGGIIFDVIHDIDYLTWIIGAIESVSCETAKRSDFEMDVEDYAEIILTHENGVKTSVHLDYLQMFKQRGFEIIGDKGTLQWRSDGKNPEKILVRLHDNVTNSWEILYDGDNPDPNDCYVVLLRKFLTSIKTGVDDPDLLNVPDAHQELKVVLSAYESAARGQKIHIRKYRNAA
jgi:predicted dehydrogenase